MICIVNEKPSQQRNFASALGFKPSKSVPGTFEGTYGGKEYRIAALRGHLYELAAPEEQVSKDKADRYHAWNTEFLPWDTDDIAWKLTKRKDVASVISTLKKAVHGCEMIYIATDDDPTGEGSGLFSEVIFENDLERGHKFARLFFADESEGSIKAALAKPVPIPDLHSEPDIRQAWFRNRWDWLSMQWTRIATADGDGRAVLRQGRLKSAMVVLVGDQLKAVSEYKKIPSYQNRFRDDHYVVYTDPDEPVFSKESDVPHERHASAVVLDKKENKTSAPPKFMDLATLAARLAPKGIPAKTVLETYQKLYEASYVSYPRTEDKKVTEEQFKQLLPLTDKIAHVVGVDASVLTHRSVRKSHVGTGMAHGANRPGLKVPASLDALAAFGAGAVEIYDLLARNWLATLAPDYEFERQTGHVKDYPTFVGSTNVPKAPGWKAVYDDDSGTDDSTASGLGTKAEPFVYTGYPPRPASPTMKWLMSQLERREVGTGATRTSIYAEVTNAKSKYPLMLEKKGNLSFTSYGDMSYRLLPGTHIGDLAMTEQVFRQMADVKQGSADPDKLLREVAGLVRDDIRVMDDNGKSMRATLGVKMAEGFVQKEKYEGVWDGETVRFNREFRGKRLTDKQCQDLLAGKEIPIMGLKSKSGSEYGVMGKLAHLEYNGHKYVGVDAGEFVRDNDHVPASWCRHKFTEDERTLLESGQRVHADDFYSKKSEKNFECDVAWEVDPRGNGKDKAIVPHFD